MLGRCASPGANFFFRVLAFVPLPYGTIWTRRCSGPAWTTGAAWVCDWSPDKVCVDASDALGCEATGLSWAEALAMNPRSKTITEQTNLRLGEPNSAAIGRLETGVGDKGLNTNTPYNFSC